LATAKKLIILRDTLNKKFGFNTTRIANELEPDGISRIPSGSIRLDIILGGGIPIGRFTHISGMESSTKSALGYHIVANAQNMRKKKIVWERYSTKEKPVYRWVICDENDKNGEPLTAALIQFEQHSYANDWGEQIGIDTENLIFVQPCGLEEGIDVAIELQKAGIDLIIIDSYAAAAPTKVLETDSQDTYQMGIKPIKLQDFHNKFQSFNNKIEREGGIGCTLIALNQRREKIGGYGHGDNTYASGGKSKDFTAAIDLVLRRSGYITIGSGDNKEIVGQEIKAKTIKNKTFPPLKVTSYDFYFEEGGICPPGAIDNAKEIIIEAVAFDIIEKSGSWFKYKGDRLAQGLDKAIEVVRNDKKLFDEIHKKLMKVAFEDVDRLEEVHSSSENDEFAVDQIDEISVEDLVPDEKLQEEKKDKKKKLKRKKSK
jgi:recombination protein RecA